MPTRAERAKVLLGRAEQGPSTNLTFVQLGLSADDKKKMEDHMHESYRIWSQAWLLPELKRLIPELKEKTK